MISELLNRLGDLVEAKGPAEAKELKAQIAPLAKRRMKLQRILSRSRTPAQQKEILAIEKKEQKLLRKLRKLIGGQATDVWFIGLR